MNIPEFLTQPNFRPLCAIQLQVAAPLVLSPERRVAPIAGGQFEGERLRGEVIEGSDWLSVREDGVWVMDVRAVLRTHDGALIGLNYRGFRHGPADVIERLNRKEEVDPSSYYFRIAPLFETSSKEYAWLNRIVAVGIGHRFPQGPLYNLFELL